MYSLRDPANKPHVTMEVDNPEYRHKTDEEAPSLRQFEYRELPTDQQANYYPTIGRSSEVGQYYGHSNSPVKEEYNERMKEFGAPHRLTLPIQ